MHTKFKFSCVTILSIFIFSLASYSQSLDDGVSLYNSGDYEKSIDVLNKIVKENPKNPKPHYWLSKCYEATFQLEKSISELQVYNQLSYEYKEEKHKIVEVKTTEPPETTLTHSSSNISINNNSLKEYKEAHESSKPEQKSPVPETTTSENKANNIPATPESVQPTYAKHQKEKPTDHVEIEIDPSLDVHSIKFSPVENIIASGIGRTGDVYFWDINGNQLKTFKAEYEPSNKSSYYVETLDYSPYGKYLATGIYRGGLDSEIKIWDLEKNKIIHILKNKAVPKLIGFNPNGQYLVSRGSSKMHVWNIKTGKDESLIKEYVPAGYLSFSPKSNLLTIANRFGYGEGSKEINTWDLGTGKKVNTIKNPKDAGIAIYNPSGNLIATNSWEDIKIWNTSGVEVKNIPGISKDRIMAMAYSPDGKYFVSGSQTSTRQATIRLFDAKNYKQIKTFNIDRYGVEEIIFSRDSKYIAARGFGSIIWIWKL